MLGGELILHFPPRAPTAAGTGDEKCEVRVSPGWG